MEGELKTRFLSLYCMVLADGIVDRNELVTLYKIGREQYGLTEEVINQIVVEVGVSTPDFETVEEKVALLYEMAEIACADGEIDETERNLLSKYVLYYGFKKENVEQIVNYLFEKAMAQTPEADVLKEIAE